MYLNLGRIFTKVVKCKFNIMPSAFWCSGQFYEKWVSVR